MTSPVGVVALQGDFQKHIDALLECGARAIQVRTPDALRSVSRLIIPGGESTTLGVLLRKSGLDKEIVCRAEEGMPIWGTCMGMILMATDIESSDQMRLSILDVTVRRNAFGRQVHSFEADVNFSGIGVLRAVFIRSPIVTRCGPNVEKLATYDSKIVAVRQGNLLGTAFHPELTPDRRVHKWFLNM